MNSSRWLTHLTLLWVAAMPTLCRALDPLPVPAPDENDRIQIVLPRPGWGGKVDLSWEGAPLAAVHVEGEPKRYVRSWLPGGGTRPTRLRLANVRGWEFPAMATFEVLRATKQYGDGRWVFRLEDAVASPAGPTGVELYTWRFDATRGGNYTVEVIGGAWREQTEAVEVECSGKLRTGQLDFTGTRAVVNKSIGRLRIAGAGPQTLRLTVGEANRPRLGRAVGVILRPAPEGPRNRPGPAGNYELAAAAAAVEGMHLRLEERNGIRRVTGWPDGPGALAWEIDDVRSGRYGVLVGVRCGPETPERIEVEVAGNGVSVLPVDTAGAVRWLEAGEVDIRRMADHPVRLRAKGKIPETGWDVEGVRLVPREPGAGNQSASPDSSSSRM